MALSIHLTNMRVEGHLIAEVDENNIGRCYSTMDGPSPFFRTIHDLVAWYNNVPVQDKHKYVTYIDNIRVMVIYIHTVSAIDQNIYIGSKEPYYAWAGEVLSTDEAAIWDFHNRCWDNQPKFLKP